MVQLLSKKIYIIGINMKILNKNKGLTLIELLVAALIFSIVIGAAMGVFISAIKLQRYNLAHQQLLSQASFAVEYMDRAIRMAVKDDGFCGFAEQNYKVSDGNRKIEFKNYKGECQEFFWDTSDNQLKVYKTDFGTPLILTSDDFEITSFNFQVSGDDIGDNIQPKVTVSMDIKGKGLGQQPRIKIQTTISQRNLDL